jgi:diguanylate cyclase (GGDEF)-like protein
MQTGGLPRIQLSTAALDRFMPMHMCVSDDGQVLSFGPTLRRLSPDRDWGGGQFFDLFEVRRPAGIGRIDDLFSFAGKRLYIARRNEDWPGMRGIAQPLADGGGLLINLSFGVTTLDAVRAHKLTQRDFAVTDLAVELLFLVEAKTALMEELRALNERITGAKVVAEEEAQTDTLTGLRNRRALDAALQGLIGAGTNFALMHLDLDYFKAVNDTLGHAAGDNVLCMVAEVLRLETRVGDTVARVGGDEFVLVLPGLSSIPSLETIATRIIRGLSKPVTFNGQTARISASIGMTISTLYDRPSPSEMLADADRALYASKRGGRGRTSFHDAVFHDAGRDVQVRPTGPK